MTQSGKKRRYPTCGLTWWTRSKLDRSISAHHSLYGLPSWAQQVAYRYFSHLGGYVTQAHDLSARLEIGQAGPAGERVLDAAIWSVNRGIQRRVPYPEEA